MFGVHGQLMLQLAVHDKAAKFVATVTVNFRTMSWNSCTTEKRATPV